MSKKQSSEYFRHWREQNRDKIRAAQLRYREKNREKIREAQRRYRLRVMEIYKAHKETT